MTEELEQLLKNLKLRRILEIYDEQLRAADKDDISLTDYAHQLKGDVPQSVRGLLLPKVGWSNAVVCLAQWRDSSSKRTSYDRLSAEAAAILKIEDHLPN